MSQCTYGACPSCESEIAESVPCSLEDLHDGDHYCANGHSWY